jgi:hypothetical protein
MLKSTATVNAQAVAQTPAPGATAGVTDQQPYTNQFQGVYYTPNLKEVFRLRHMEGEGQGGVDAYTNFGFTKFVWTNQGLVMLDIGGRVTNDAEAGFTTGAHRRFVAGDLMFGAGVFYDMDMQEEFHQGSVAFELFSPNWAFRTNGYYVLGDDVEEDDEYERTAATTIFFQGNNILADNLLLEEEFQVAMSGADFEVARGIGLPASEVFVGGYFYAGEIGEDALGAKGGVRGFLRPDLSATLSVSGDDVFGANVFGGVTWFLGAKGGLSRPDIARRLMVPVERNEQVVVNEVERVTPVAGPVVLTFEDDAIEIVHVDSAAAAGGDGTFEAPFDALPETQEADIVYVWADSTFTGESYTLAEDQRFLGEGSGRLHLVETEELDEIILPSSGNGGTTSPIIAASLGDAITLAAQDNEVSNFTITGAGGNGIYGLAVTDFDINRNTITGSAGRGIFLQLVSGVVDDSPVARGEVEDNVVDANTLQNIQITLDSDFVGEVSGNTANSSVTLRGIEITGPFAFIGEIEDNTANGNPLQGILVNVDAFVGDIENNTTNTNVFGGMVLAFGVFDGAVVGNTANSNLDAGIDFTIDGDGFSDVEITDNVTNLNTFEGIRLLFAGTGTSRVEVENNRFAGNNGGIGREFFAENLDEPGNRPEVFIELEGNRSTNLLTNPPFNYEFDNNDLFADGEMFLEVGDNIGTVEDDEDVEPAEFPWD